MIIKGQLELIPDEDEISADPFYNFLIREGLYEESLTMGKSNSLEEELEESLTPIKVKNNSSAVDPSSKIEDPTVKRVSAAQNEWQFKKW